MVAYSAARASGAIASRAALQSATAGRHVAVVAAESAVAGRASGHAAARGAGPTAASAGAHAPRGAAMAAAAAAAHRQPEAGHNEVDASVAGNPSARDGGGGKGNDDDVHITTEMDPPPRPPSSSPTIPAAATVAVANPNMFLTPSGKVHAASELAKRPAFTPGRHHSQVMFAYTPQTAIQAWEPGHPPSKQ